MYRCCRPWFTIQVVQIFEILASIGPGYLASGWKGESRYRTIERPRVVQNTRIAQKTLLQIPKLAKSILLKDAGRTNKRPLIIGIDRGSHFLKTKCVH